LNFKRLVYFSPREYNFDTDSIDLVITIKDKNKLKNAIIEMKDAINKALDKNKSYDGYMALTVSNVDEELEKTKKKDYEVDIIVLRELLDLDCNDFNIKEYFIMEIENESKCDCPVSKGHFPKGCHMNICKIYKNKENIKKSETQ